MIRGTVKRNLDGVNMIVRRYGIPALMLSILAGAGVLLVMIFMFISIWLMVGFIVAYLAFLRKLGVYIKNEAKKGNENPMEDYLDYVFQVKVIKQSQNIRVIYESKRSN